MKKMLLAAVLCAVTIPSVAYAVIVANDTDQITETEIKERAVVCAGLLDGSFDGSKVIQGYRLDTIRKRRDFALQCKLLEYGWKVGRNSRVS